MENFDHILLFKTNIKTERDKLILESILENDNGIDYWSIDMEDQDCVLKVISYTLSHQRIIELVSLEGYQCIELI